MFLCRTGRLSAAAVDQTAKYTGSFLLQAKASRLRNVTLTLHNNNNTFQAHRRFCVSGGVVDSTRFKPPLQNRDPVSGFVVTDWRRLNRVTATALNLPQSAACSDVIREPLVRTNRRHSCREEPVGNVLFTGNWVGFSRRCASWTTQIRASSTKSDRGEEQTAGNKEERQNLMDSSTTSPSTAKAPEEPEGGKPNKTQQLKKVFKQYGAVGVSFHIGISLMSLGMFYFLISSGIDMAAVLCKLGFSEAVVRSKMAAGTSTFVLAYAVHKLFAPVRISITLVSVPLIVRYFRKTGLFKPPAPTP